MYKFHLLSLPHAKVNKDFCHCAFTQKIFNMSKMIGMMWYELVTYWTEWWQPPYWKFIETFSQEDFDRIYNKSHKDNLFDSTNQEWWKIYCDNTIEAIQKERSWKDILLISYWYAHKPIKDALGIATIEMGIWYPQSMQDCFRVFESYAWMYNHYGQDQVRAENINNQSARNQAICPSDYDIVIPNYFDLNDFVFNDKPEDYFAFVGRPSWDKWRSIAIDVCQRKWIKLKLAWQSKQVVDQHLEEMKKDGKDVSMIEHIGRVWVKERNELMKNALWLFVPTLYIEPFGWVQIEALLSWTPLITSDNGVFNETNRHWTTGYRCRHFSDYSKAVDNILDGKIYRIICREHGEQYGLDNIKNYYDSYFKKIINLQEWKWENQWYSKEVEWLNYNVREKFI